MSKITPARVASLLAGVSALAAGLTPAVANLDTTSTAGCIAGAIAVLGVLQQFLIGQRAHEQRVAASANLARGGYVSGPVMSTGTITKVANGATTTPVPVPGVPPKRPRAKKAAPKPRPATGAPPETPEAK